MPTRAVKDGVSEIKVKSKRLQDKHEKLQELLVPSNGPEDTIQGEAIRITERIVREILDNSGINWDSEFSE